jgi:hypothetical protein
MDKYQEELFGIYQDIGKPYKPLLLMQELVDMKTNINSIDLDEVKKSLELLSHMGQHDLEHMYKISPIAALQTIQRLIDTVKEAQDE